jgi:hypothetical protein
VKKWIRTVEDIQYHILDSHSHFRRCRQGVIRSEDKTRDLCGRGERARGIINERETSDGRVCDGAHSDVPDDDGGHHISDPSFADDGCEV